MTVIQKIEHVLDLLRPGIERHRGGVEFVSFDEKAGIVSIKMTGMCVGCPYSNMTLKGGIEEMMTSMIPEVKEVIAVTD